MECGPRISGLDFAGDSECSDCTGLMVYPGCSPDGGFFVTVFFIHCYRQTDRQSVTREHGVQLAEVGSLLVSPYFASIPYWQKLLHHPDCLLVVVVVAPHCSYDYCCNCYNYNSATNSTPWAIKHVALYFCLCHRQLLTDFQNSLTGKLCRQSVVMGLLYISPCRKCVSTLRCEI